MHLIAFLLFVYSWPLQGPEVSTRLSPTIESFNQFRI